MSFIWGLCIMQHRTPHNLDVNLPMMLNYMLVTSLSLYANYYHVITLFAKFDVIHVLRPIILYASCDEHFCLKYHHV